MYALSLHIAHEHHETAAIHHVLRRCRWDDGGWRLRTLCYPAEKGCLLYAWQTLEKSEVDEELALRRNDCERLVPTLPTDSGSRWSCLRVNMANLGYSRVFKVSLLRIGGW